MTAATVRGGQTIVLLTLRVDFYGHCSKYPKLAALLSDYQFLVGAMEEDELRRAIERPSQLAGGEFEPGRVDVLLEEVKHRPGALPLLEYTLQELWNRRKGPRLTHAALQEIGHVRGALQQHADKIYSTFTDAEQEICKHIVLRLSTVRWSIAIHQPAARR